MASLNSILTRFAASITLACVILVGVPALYQHVKMRDADAVAERSRGLINDDNTAPSVVEQQVRILDSALTESAGCEYMRDLLLQFLVGIPLIVWFVALAVMWWFKEDDLTL
jgi:hypothetical protein